MKTIDLVLVKMLWNTLKSQKNCLSPENQKTKKHLSLKIWLSQEKHHKK